MTNKFNKISNKTKKNDKIKFNKINKISPQISSKPFRWVFIRFSNNGCFCRSFRWCCCYRCHCCICCCCCPPLVLLMLSRISCVEQSLRWAGLALAYQKIPKGPTSNFMSNCMERKYGICRWHKAIFLFIKNTNLPSENTNHKFTFGKCTRAWPSINRMKRSERWPALKEFINCINFFNCDFW